jgi:hypothetical protein
VENTENVVNPDTNNPATISIPVGLLGGDASITVQDTAASFPAGDEVGFLIQVPGAGLLNLALLQPVVVTAVNINTAAGTSTDVTSAGASRTVALDLLGLLANNGESAAVVTSTGTFNAVRIDVAGVANVLTNINVYEAGVCVP